MFFYRYNVSESHLNKFSRSLHELFLSGNTIKVATFCNLQIHKVFDDVDLAWVYFVIDPLMALVLKAIPKNSKPSEVVLGFVVLSKIRDWVAMEVNILYVNPLFRGQGVASALYDGVMKDGVIMISGDRQNQKSRSLWLKMVSNPRYTVWAQDLLDLSRHEPIYIDEEGALECKLKLYDDIKTRRRVKRQDIRMIAINPRYVK